MYLTHTASQQVFFMFSGGALAEGFQARMFEFQNFERRFEVSSFFHLVIPITHILNPWTEVIPLLCFLQ